MKLKVNIFIIFFIIFSSEYYAQIIGPNNGSLMDIWDLSAQSGFNRKFTVLKSIKLKTVDVFPTNWNDGCQGDGSTKSTTIDLYKNGLLFSSKDVQVKCGKLASVDLNFDLNVGNYELRIRNIKQGSFKVSSDADEKSIAGVISLTDNRISGVNNTYSGVFFNWDIEVKIVKVVPLPDTIKICKGEKFNLEFSAANSEIWTGTEVFTILNDSTIQFAPAKSTVYYFESPSILPAGENSVMNGDFEKGNTGFTTEYRFNQNIDTPGDYMIGSKGNNAYVNTVDRTLKTNTGKMLVADGADAIYNTINNYSMSVWCQTIKVYPNTNYQAEFWATQASNSTQFPSFLHMEINGVDVGNWLTPPSSGNWGADNGVWNSGLNTSAEMCIKNGVSNSTGNNFLLDDISLIATEPILAYAKTDSVVVILCDSTVSSYKPEAGIGDFKTHEYNLNCGGDYYACIDLKAKGAKKYTWSSPSEDMQAITKLNDSTYQFCRINGGLNIFTPLQYQIIMESEDALQKDTIQLKINRNKCSEMGGGVSTLGNMEKTLPCGTDTVSLHAKGGTIYVWSSPSGNMNLITKKNDSLYIFTKPNNSIGNYSYQVVSIWKNPACQFECKFEQTDTFLLKINTLDCTCIDTDKDGVCDEDDLDDDNDGILDVNECMISDFHWSSPPQVNGKTATGKINNIDYTYTSTVNILTSSSIFSYNTFPASFNIPNTKVIRNDFISTNKINFAQPVLNPTLVFSSIGNGGQNVPIKFSNPVEILFKSGGVTVNSSTQISGQEGYVVLRMNGTYSEISFDYLANESWVNFSFGADFATFCDTDGDGISDYLDLDSDNDGCPDAVEGGGGFFVTDLEAKKLKGAVDVNGIPLMANGGQSVGLSQDVSKLSPNCSICIPPVTPTINNNLGDTIQVCQNNTITNLVDYVNGENIKWYNSLESDSAYTIAPLINNNQIGLYKYWVTQTKENCESEKKGIFYLIKAKPSINVQLNQSSICPGDTAFISVEPQGISPFILNYNSSVSGEQQLNINSLDKYTLKVFKTDTIRFNSITDSNCSLDTTILQTVLVKDSIKIKGLNGFRCDEGKVVLKAETNEGEIFWYNTALGGTELGKGLEFTTPNITSQTKYFVQSISNTCVSERIEIIANIFKSPNPDLGEDVTICEGDSIVLKSNYLSNDGYSVKWNNTTISDSIIVHSNGKYFIEVIDSNLCMGKDSITITLQAKPTIDLGEDIKICKGFMVDLDAGDNWEKYEWNTGESTSKISTNQQGVYRVTITDLMGCKNEDSLKLIVKELPEVKLGNDTTICSNAFLELDAKNPGLNYTWNTGASAQKIKVTQTGTYSVNVTDEIGCLGSDEIKITVNPMPVVNLGKDTSFCKGGTHTLKAGNNGFNYLWSTGSNTQEITVNQSGTYEVRVFDAIGCADTSKIKIVVKELPEVKLGNDTTICSNAFLELDAKNPGLNYVWNTGANTKKIKVTETGTYSVTVTDEIGCLGSDEIQITVNLMPVVNLGNDTTFCKGGTHTLKAGNNGFNYLWSTGANTQEITVNESGTYEVRVFDAIGCADTSKIKIVVKDLPEVKLGNDTTICSNAFLELDAKNPGLNYAWNTGASAQKIKVTETGAYSVTVTDEIGCMGTNNVFVTNEIIEDPYPEKEIYICEGTQVTLEPSFTNNYKIYWKENKNSETILVDHPGIYTSYVESEYCKETFVIQVFKIDTPMATITDINGKDFYCFDLETTTLTIQSGESNLIFDWDDFGRSDEVEITSAGTYKVTVYNQYCSSSFEKEIEEYCTGLIFIPNAFTPGNKDGVNDVFKPVVKNIQDYELRIFNRWGEMIFKTNDVNEGWDGTIHGKNCQMDVYVYQIDYSYNSEYKGVYKNKKVGTFTLYR